MTFSAEQKKILSEPVPAELVRQRRLYGNSGPVLSYLEAHEAIRMANDIFGPDGWSSEVRELKLEHMAEITTGNGKKMWIVVFTCVARVHAGGVYHDGAATGSGQQGNIADAMDKAAKTAESDAIKRALVKFGDRFGLSLYRDDDPQQHRQPQRQPSAPPPATMDKSVQAAQADPNGFASWITGAFEAATTIADLQALYYENKAGLAWLKQHHPQLYQPANNALNARHSFLSQQP